jgi:hypothetical protein
MIVSQKVYRRMEKEKAINALTKQRCDSKDFVNVGVLAKNSQG